MRRSHFSDHALPSTVIPWVIDLGSERNKHLQKTHSILDIVLSVEHTLFHLRIKKCLRKGCLLSKRHRATKVLDRGTRHVEPKLQTRKEPRRNLPCWLFLKEYPKELVGWRRWWLSGHSDLKPP